MWVSEIDMTFLADDARRASLVVRNAFYRGKIEITPLYNRLFLRL